MASSKSNGSSAREVVISAAEQLQELTGKPIESVLGVERDDDDDGWSVTVEVLELERIPNTTDLLGKYELKLDGKGELSSMRRLRRYARAEGGDE